jgi:hypothetical protein
MTIAIGAPFRYGEVKGALVCADSRIVSTDLATKWGTKTHLSLTPRKTAFAIADASEDGDAAKMLAGEITSALCKDAVDNLGKVSEIVKAQMTEWYSAYGVNRPPATQFVLAASVGGHCALYQCSPPNTVLLQDHPFAVGQGARAVDPLIPGSYTEPPEAEAALLKVVYWMYRAKRDEGSMCGGGTTVFMISQWGKMALFGPEVDEAEDLAKEVDKVITKYRNGLLSWGSKTAQQTILADTAKEYLDVADKMRAIAFPSLEWLAGKEWVKPKPKNKPKAAVNIQTGK